MAAKKKSGPSGVHKNPRRLLTQTMESWERQGSAAIRAGFKNWGDWAKSTLDFASRNEPVPIDVAHKTDCESSQKQLNSREA